jgi:hypothetical protein
MRTEREREKEMNTAIINRGCSTDIIYGMKNISLIYERSFVKFAA